MYFNVGKQRIPRSAKSSEARMSIRDLLIQFTINSFLLSICPVFSAVNHPTGKVVTEQASLIRPRFPDTEIHYAPLVLNAQLLIVVPMGSGDASN